MRDYTEIDGGQEATSCIERPRWERKETVAQVVALSVARAQGLSERKYAEAAEVPRCSLRYWDRRRRGLEQAGVPDFIETPAGLAWVFRVVWAAVFVLTLRAPGGIRAVCEFLQLSGLNEIVASSYGAVQTMAVQMVTAVNLLGTEMRTELVQLAGGGPPRSITLCQDETFHPQICLVALEPVSGFIVLEKYVAHRDAETWTSATKQALAGLSVRVRQSTSDEGAALRKHAQEGLDAVHSPDLFHVEHELHGATVLALIQRLKRATTAYEAALAATARAHHQQDQWLARKHGPGRPPNFAKRIEEAVDAEQDAEHAMTQAQQDREGMKRAINRISAVYHPYDLTTGSARSGQLVEQELAACFADIDAIAQRAGFPQNVLARIDKARRVVDKMVETIHFVRVTTAARLAALGLHPDQLRVVIEGLLPAMYLERVAGKAASAEERNTLHDRAVELVAPCHQPDGPLAQLKQPEKKLLLSVVQDLADLFQRSSSCVEGRNGHLALFHHGQHRIPDKKLQALTVVHNFHARRDTGDTAAERFFGVPHDRLFDRLLTRLPMLPRPAHARPSPPRLTMATRCA